MSEGQKEPADDQGEIYEEYMKLLAGGRVSSRRSQTQSVMERNRQEQMNQIQQTQRRRKESKKPSRRGGRPGMMIIGGGGQLDAAEIDTDQMSSSAGGRKRSSTKNQIDGSSQQSEERGYRQKNPGQGDDSPDQTQIGSALMSSRLKNRRDSKQGRKLGAISAIKQSKFKSQQLKHGEFELGEKQASGDASVQSRRKTMKHHSTSVGGNFAHISLGSGGSSVATRPFGGNQQTPYFLPHYQAKEESKQPGAKSNFSLIQQSSNTDTDGNFDPLAQEEVSDEDSSLMSGHRRGDADEVEGEEADASSKRDGSQAISENQSNNDSDDFKKPQQGKQDQQRKRPSFQASQERQNLSKQAGVLLIQAPHLNQMELNQSQCSVAALPDSNTAKDGGDFERELDSKTFQKRDIESKVSAATVEKRPSTTADSKIADYQAKVLSPEEEQDQTPMRLSSSIIIESPKKTTFASISIQGNSPSKRLDTLQKDVWRQLEELKSLDKVFPDPQQTVGCYIQMEDQKFGVIQKCEKIQGTKGESIADFSLLVKGLQTADEIKSVPATSIKYLARAYLCNIGEICTEKMPPKLLDTLNTENESAQIVLLQMISTKKSQEAEESALSEGNSVHRLHALIAGSGDKKSFTLCPVVFKPSQNRSRNTKVSLSPSAPTSADAQTEETVSLCYKSSEIASKSLQIARMLQKAFVNSYLARVSKVRLTKQNIADHLLSIVQFDQSDEVQDDDQEMVVDELQNQNNTSVGVVTNYAVDEQSGEVSIFVSLFIPNKAGHTVTWVSLRQTKVYANLSLGLVSQKWLEKLQIHDADTTQKNQSAGQQVKAQGNKQISKKHFLAPQRNLGANKLKQLQMLNWQESLLEKRKMIQMEEEGNKMDIADGEYCKIRQALATSDSRASNCKKCNYITKLESNPQIKVLMCSRCSGKYHEKCLQPYERNISAAEKNWRCPDCQRCANCKSQQCQDQLMTCLKCNTPTHYDCLPLSFRSSIRSLYTIMPDPEDEDLEVKKLNIQTKRFRCQNCIKCQNCDTREAGPKRHHKWSKDFKLCANCNQMRDKRLFCPVCERFQPSEQLDKKVADELQFETTNGVHIIKGEKMIKCKGCAMLVHVDCDRMLLDPVIRKQIMPEHIEGETLKISANFPHYKCPNCRKINRNSLFEQIIEVLIAADKPNHFLQPFWEQMQPQAQQEYFDIIKRKPICFSTIIQDIRQTKKYLLNPKDFWKDIERVFVNAKAYNDSPEVYNAASILYEKAIQFTKNKKLCEVVEANSRATMEEQRFTVLMRKIAKDLRKGIVPSSHGGEQTRPPTEAKVTAKEMMQGSEVSDLRVFGISNSVLDVIPQASTSQDGGIMFFQGQLATAEHLHSEAVKKSKLPAHKQWEKLMEDLATNDERDTCWYPNPIKISFEDPTLIFEEMCYLCGAFGNQEDFLCCNLCCESFHPYCLPYPRSNREQFQDYWRCYNCIFCEKCHSSKQWEGLLICAVCDKVDHFWCLEPQLIQVPECNWKCPECFKCGKCGTKSFFSEKDIENKVNLDPNEKFVLSFDFELCYQCGQDEYRKSYCSICSEKTGLGLNSVQLAGGSKTMAIDQDDIPFESGLLRCNQCNFYSHLSCSKTDQESLERHARTFNMIIREQTGEMGQETARSIYKCIDCLLIDKLPSFYIHHQCELYESLHQSIQRNALLFSLIDTILGRYFPDSVVPAIYIANFIGHHAKVFREDRLLLQWLALLDSAPSAQLSEAQSCTDISDKVASRTEELPVIASKSDADIVMTGGDQESFETEKQWSGRLTCLYQVEVRDADMLPEEESMGNSEQESSSCRKSQVFQELFGHKTGFLPVRRDLYENLLRKENNRVAREEFFESLEDLASKMTVPTDQALSKVDLNELFVKIELRAVLKIQLLFSQWAQQLVHNTVSQISHFTGGSDQQQAIQEAVSNKRSKNGDGNDPTTAITQIDFCQETDVLVDNPQKRLKCLLCSLNGERSITGRLIPFQINQFVHVNCAMWTQEVQEGQEENDQTRELYNFFFAYNEFKNIRCDFCKKSGATIFCSNRVSKRCGAAFHFPCAYSSRKVAFLLNTDIYCEQCIPKTPEAIAGFPIEFRNYQKRRIIIMRNNEPQCTAAFQSQIRKSHQGGPAVQHQLVHSAINKALPTNINNEGQQSPNESPKPKADVGVTQSQTGPPAEGVAPPALTSTADVGVIIACNKWRPYYYDMFNRVGNLTILSLSRRRNAVIESLHTFTHQNLKSTWHERFNLRFPEEDQTDFSSIRIYWNYKANSAKTAEMTAKQDTSKSKRGGPPNSKGYFLFTGNKVLDVARHDYSKLKKFVNRRLLEHLGSKLDKLILQQSQSDIDDRGTRTKQSVEQFWLEQISNLAQRYPLFCQENTYLTSKVISGLEKFPIQYWNNPGEKLVSPGEKQGLDLKDLGVAGFFFKSGYKSLEAQKITDSKSNNEDQYQVAEQAIVDSATARFGHQPRRTDQSIVKDSSGHQVMSIAQHLNGVHDSTSISFLGNSQGVSGSAGQGVASSGASIMQKNTSLESIFKQILEANQVNDQKTSPLIASLVANDKHDDEDSDDGTRKDLSTKVMNYEQIMACLGKKTLKVKQEERRKIEEERARVEALKQQQMQLDAMYGGGAFQMYRPSDGEALKVSGIGQDTEEEEKKDTVMTSSLLNSEDLHERRRKGSKQSDLNETINKGNDINTAMKYRAAKERPKLVEVWISKIHRNGLFACQALAPKDIVIEYVGEKIRDPVADKREVSYDKLGVGDCYNFRLDRDYIIDATFFGSKARYINHSCEPNLISEYLSVNGETHIIFVAARKIKSGEELTFDYNFMPEIESIECFCGSEKCRGRLA